MQLKKKFNQVLLVDLLLWVVDVVEEVVVELDMTMTTMITDTAKVVVVELVVDTVDVVATNFIFINKETIKIAQV
jgi:hypothetical protein